MKISNEPTPYLLLIGYNTIYRFLLFHSFYFGGRLLI